MRSLITDARFASGGDRTPERPLGEWLDFIRGLVESYLVLDEDDRAGKAAIAHFLAELAGLSDLGLGRQPVSYRVAAELAERALSATPASRGHYLSTGVTVASFVPMRAIPFRAVFVLGLGQDAFPRPAGRHELDLRADGRRAGDVDRREQDLYMFLETLLSARDHVTLSYVARDEITGDELPASPVLLELSTILGQGYLDPAALALLFGDDAKARPSLRRYDDIAQRRAVLPAAESEHLAKELGVAMARGERSARTSPTSPAKAQTVDHARDELVIPLSTLRRFLEDPLQASARFRLGMHDDDDRVLADVEDELFDLDKRGSSWLLRASMTDALVAAQATPPWQELLAAYQRRASHAELGGQSPTGLFRCAGTQVETELLHTWQEAMPEILGPGRAECRVVRLVKQAGQGAQGKAAGIVHCPAPKLRHLLARPRGQAGPPCPHRWRDQALREVGQGRQRHLELYLPDRDLGHEYLPGRSAGLPRLRGAGRGRQRSSLSRPPWRPFLQPRRAGQSAHAGIPSARTRESARLPGAAVCRFS